MLNSSPHNSYISFFSTSIWALKSSPNFLKDASSTLIPFTCISPSTETSGISILLNKSNKLFCSSFLYVSSYILFIKYVLNPYTYFSFSLLSSSWNKVICLFFFLSCSYCDKYSLASISKYKSELASIVYVPIVEFRSYAATSIS